MLKKVIILIVLSSILVALLFINSNKESDDPSKYTMIEYEITKITAEQYYGKSEDGTEISFSKDILSGEKIEVHDVVICYFKKDNIADGLVKVERK